MAFTDETRHIVQLIHLKGRSIHFEHECIIKLSKKGSCPPPVKSNAEFRTLLHSRTHNPIVIDDSS